MREKETNEEKGKKTRKMKGEGRERKKKKKRNGERSGGEKKGIEVAVRRIWGEMDIKPKIEEIKKIGKRNKKKRRMALVMIEDKEEKREVMKKKVTLKNRRVKIENDWTRREREM